MFPWVPLKRETNIVFNFINFSKCAKTVCLPITSSTETPVGSYRAAMPFGASDGPPWPPKLPLQLDPGDPTMNTTSYSIDPAVMKAIELRIEHIFSKFRINLTEEETTSRNNFS